MQPNQENQRKKVFSPQDSQPQGCWGGKALEASSKRILKSICQKQDSQTHWMSLANYQQLGHYTVNNALGCNETIPASEMENPATCGCRGGRTAPRREQRPVSFSLLFLLVFCTISGKREGENDLCFFLLINRKLEIEASKKRVKLDFHLPGGHKKGQWGTTILKN